MIIFTRKVRNKRLKQESERLVIDLRTVDLSMLLDAEKILTFEVVDGGLVKCRVGVNAHKSIPIHREEVFMDIERIGRKTAPRDPKPDEPDTEAA